MILTITKIWRFLPARVGSPLFCAAILFLVYFAYSAIRDYRLQGEIERQSQRIDGYERQAETAVSDAKQHLQMFEKTHATTILLLETVRAMSENIKDLAAQDAQMEKRLGTIRIEYENARKGNQTENENNRPTKKTAVRRRVPDNRFLRHRSLRRREDDLLANDRKLYPTGGGGGGDESN